MTADDSPFLWSFLGLITGEPSASLPAQPDLAKYVTGWGREGDFGVIAEGPEGPIGAAWARQFTLAETPFVWVSPNIPECALAVCAAHRRQGLGRSLMKLLIAQARLRVAGLCLNVRDHNPARELYRQLGFEELSGSAKPNRFGSLSLGMVLRFDHCQAELAPASRGP